MTAETHSNCPYCQTKYYANLHPKFLPCGHPLCESCVARSLMTHDHTCCRHCGAIYGIDAIMAAFLANTKDLRKQLEQVNANCVTMSFDQEELHNQLETAKKDLKAANKAILAAESTTVIQKECFKNQINEMKGYLGELAKLGKEKEAELNQAAIEKERMSKEIDGLKAQLVEMGKKVMQLEKDAQAETIKKLKLRLAEVAKQAAESEKARKKEMISKDIHDAEMADLNKQIEDKMKLCRAQKQAAATEINRLAAQEAVYRATIERLESKVDVYNYQLGEVTAKYNQLLDEHSQALETSAAYTPDSDDVSEEVDLPEIPVDAKVAKPPDIEFVRLEPVMEKLFIRGLPGGITESEVEMILFMRGDNPATPTRIWLRESNGKTDCIAQFEDKNEVEMLIWQWNGKCYPGSQHQLTVDYWKIATKIDELTEETEMAIFTNTAAQKATGNVGSQKSQPETVQKEKIVVAKQEQTLRENIHGSKAICIKNIPGRVTVAELTNFLEAKIGEKIDLSKEGVIFVATGDWFSCAKVRFLTAEAALKAVNVLSNIRYPKSGQILKPSLWIPNYVKPPKTKGKKKGKANAKPQNIGFWDDGTIVDKELLKMENFVVAENIPLSVAADTVVSLFEQVAPISRDKAGSPGIVLVEKEGTQSAFIDFETKQGAKKACEVMLGRAFRDPSSGIYWTMIVLLYKD
ncbi:unnamed protein product, partial [Mesorhabditis spiculigera]